MSSEVPSSERRAAENLQLFHANWFQAEPGFHGKCQHCRRPIGGRVAWRHIKPQRCLCRPCLLYMLFLKDQPRDT